MLDLDMTAWVHEKLGSVLASLARIADIAKDPETPDWYRRNLRSHLHPGFYSGLKVLLWSYNRLNDWTPEAAKQPTDHGILGLAALFTELKLPINIDIGTPATDPDDEEDREPSSLDGAPDKLADPWASKLRHAVMYWATYHLASPELPAAEARLLAWIAHGVAGSEYADTALMTRKFLASDVGLSDVDGAAALQSLIEKGIVYEVRQLGDDTRIALRIIVTGLNDPRHEPPTH
jgi:hypothetical protein